MPKDALLEVFVHKITLDNGGELYLISNVEADALSLGRLYQRRYDVEFDIRDLQVTMDTENIRAKELDTVLKELLGSVIAYNLLAQFRRQAAKLAKITPRRLSFKGVWLSLTYHLLHARAESLAEWEKIDTTALISASRRRLRNRPQPRSYPRAAHPRSPKNHRGSEGAAQKQTTNSGLMSKSWWHWAPTPGFRRTALQACGGVLGSVFKELYRVCEVGVDWTAPGSQFRESIPEGAAHRKI